MYHKKLNAGLSNKNQTTPLASRPGQARPAPKNQPELLTGPSFYNLSFYNRLRFGPPSARAACKQLINTLGVGRVSLETQAG